MTLQEAQAKLNTAFAALRKAGLIARQRFSCCRECADCEIAIDVEKLPETRRAKIKGAVFYTRQGGFNNGGDGTYLSFGPIHTTGGQVGLGTQLVGELVVAHLKAAGLAVVWDGKASTSIWVATTPVP